MPFLTQNLLIKNYVMRTNDTFDRLHQKNNLGEKLLLDALKRSVNNSRVIGSAAVIVTAKEKAVAFYKRYGFNEFNVLQPCYLEGEKDFLRQRQSHAALTLIFSGAITIRSFTHFIRF